MQSCVLGHFRATSSPLAVMSTVGVGVGVARPTSELSRRSARTEWNGVSQSGWVVGNVSAVCARASDRRDTANVRRRRVCEEPCCHDVRVSRGQRHLATSQPCPSLRNMARDSRRVAVAVVGGGSGGSATVRCKLVLVFLVLLLAIVVPAAYADSQGESRREFLIKHATCVSLLMYAGVIRFLFSTVISTCRRSLYTYHTYCIITVTPVVLSARL